MDETVLARDAKNAKRMRHFVPHYLEPRLTKSWDIVSIGCGSGIDVEMLRRDGFDAFGFDPSRDNQFPLRDEHTRRFLRPGSVEDFPFGEKRFDFAYALEVIEHVGCRSFGTYLLPGWRERRRVFLKACLAHLKSPGRLLLSTSNRLCPIDPGHTQHDYSAVGRLACRYRLPFGISIPWHSRNFLYSLGQLREDIKLIAPSAVVRTESIADYPSIARDSRMIGRIARGVLSMIDLKPLRASPVSPLLVITIDV